MVMHEENSLAEDLVNTYDATLDRPEHLREPADLARFLREHGFGAPAPLSEQDLREAKELREPLRAVFEARDEAEAARLVNRLLSGARVMAELDVEGGSTRLRLAPEEGLEVVERLRAASALGLALAIEKIGFERLRVCAADPCRDVFIDTSRNSTRRYCSLRCANRHNVATFRRRRSPSGAATPPDSGHDHPAALQPLDHGE